MDGWIQFVAIREVSVPTARSLDEVWSDENRDDSILEISIGYTASGASYNPIVILPRCLARIAFSRKSIGTTIKEGPSLSNAVLIVSSSAVDSST